MRVHSHVQLQALGDLYPLEIATKLVTPEITVGWVLGLYPDAGEAGGSFHYRARLGAVRSPGRRLIRIGRVRKQARRARAKVRRYAAANRLDRLGTLTYKGDGSARRARVASTRCALLQAAAVRGCRRAVSVRVGAGVAQDGSRPARALRGRSVHRSRRDDSVWGRGFTHIKRLGNVKHEGSLSSARRAAGLLVEVRDEGVREHERSPGLHRYEVAQGFRPRVERIVATTREGRARSGERTHGTRRRDDVVVGSRPTDWQGPPAVWAAWDD